MPRARILDTETFAAVARKLAKRVVAGRMDYSFAETALLKQRAGSHYQRLDRAEDEAVLALSRAFRRMELRR